MELLTKLGIDWRLLIAQIVNFVILVLILWRVLYKPLLNMMHAREEKVAKGLDMAKEAEERKSAAQAEYEQLMAKARKESNALLEATKKDADALRKATLEETNVKVQETLTRAKAQLASQKNAMVNEARFEIADLVVHATEQVASAKLDRDGDASLIDEALSSFGTLKT